MYAFTLMVMILLPGTDAVQRAHPVYSFTVESTPIYDEEGCYAASHKLGDWIEAHLPKGAYVHFSPQCIQSDLVES